MTWKDLAQTQFIEAISGDDTFMRVSAGEGLVTILLTKRHGGDIDITLAAQEQQRVVHALERAIRALEIDGAVEERQIAIIHTFYPGSTLVSRVRISVELGLAILDLSLEGVENEEDQVWVYLTIEQCKWLIEALGSANHAI